MILNLTNPGRSTIQYKKIMYPDNQVSIQILGLIESKDAPIWIQSRFNDYTDLFYILAATDALRSADYNNIHLYIPCFLGQRSDRRFDDNQPFNQSFDLKIITDIINAQKYKSVRILHPHSDVLPALINSSSTKSNSELLEFALSDLGNYYPALVSPDAGAYKQVYKYGEIYKCNVITSNKSRDLLSGNITIDVSGSISGRNCLIVDDYCDGGRTFIVLAQRLRELGAAKVYLCVTHALFSRGVEVFDGIIDKIYTTNSISDETFECVHKMIVI